MQGFIGDGCRLPGTAPAQVVAHAKILKFASQESSEPQTWSKVDLFSQGCFTSNCDYTRASMWSPKSLSLSISQWKDKPKKDPSCKKLEKGYQRLDARTFHGTVA